MLLGGTSLQFGRCAGQARAPRGATAAPAAGRPKQQRRARYNGSCHTRGIAASVNRDVRTRATEDGEGGQWYTRPCGPNSLEVSSVQELVDVLATDKLVIVDFFAPWCGACRALFPKLHKLLNEYPDVLLVKVNFEANKAMCKSLGIKVLPFFHFYHGAAGRVAAFSATVSKLERLKDALDAHSGAICSLEEPPGLAEFPDVRATPRVTAA